MGHTRLGTIAKTRKWSAVVATIADGEEGGARTALAGDVSQVARQALHAAEAGLNRAVDDAGLQFTFYLLTQIVLAARETDWRAGLGRLGLSIQPDSTLVDLVVEVQSAIDERVLLRGQATDISEMAQQAAGEAISALAGPRARTLFGEGAEDARLALRTLSTRDGFGTLGQRFFGGFMARFLNFYLSRVTAEQVGGARLQHVGDLTAFNQALERHCVESARIVRDFCAQWYSATEFREGITLANTSDFMAVAVRKLQAELRQQSSDG